jgi:hypothetical protein
MFKGGYSYLTGHWPTEESSIEFQVVAMRSERDTGALVRSRDNPAK